jgi:hypothetical protein
VDILEYGDLKFIRTALKDLKFDATPLWRTKQGIVGLAASVEVKEISRPNPQTIIVNLIYTVHDKSSPTEVMRAQLEAHYHYVGELTALRGPKLGPQLVHPALQHCNMWFSSVTSWAGPIPINLIVERQELKH